MSLKSKHENIQKQRWGLELKTTRRNHSTAIASETIKHNNYYYNEHNEIMDFEPTKDRRQPPPQQYQQQLRTKTARMNHQRQQELRRKHCQDRQQFNNCENFACYRGRLGLSGPKCPKCPKCPKRSSKRVKTVKNLSMLPRFRLRFGLCGPQEPRGSGN